MFSDIISCFFCKRKDFRDEDRLVGLENICVVNSPISVEEQHTAASLHVSVELFRTASSWWDNPEQFNISMNKSVRFWDYVRFLIFTLLLFVVYQVNIYDWTAYLNFLSLSVYKSLWWTHKTTVRQIPTLYKSHWWVNHMMFSVNTSETKEKLATMNYLIKT